MALAQVRGAIDSVRAQAWLAAIDAHPAWRRAGGPRDDFNPYSSSLRAAVVASLDLGRIAAELLSGETGTLARACLGDELACDVDQCWVRRQYAPHRYPPDHAPHSWHQDGALGFDFQHAAPGEGDLLAMTTCWIALTPCGSDAPGLEFAAPEPARLLPLDELAEPSVRARHAPNDFLRPVLEPGDALVFGGDVLHHTHVAPTMTRDRTSLELRFFSAGCLPQRLRGDRFLPLN